MSSVPHVFQPSVDGVLRLKINRGDGLEVCRSRLQRVAFAPDDGKGAKNKQAPATYARARVYKNTITTARSLFPPSDCFPTRQNQRFCSHHCGGKTSQTQRREEIRKGAERVELVEDPPQPLACFGDHPQAFPLEACAGGKCSHLHQTIVDLLVQGKTFTGLSVGWERGTYKGDRLFVSADQPCAWLTVLCQVATLTRKRHAPKDHFVGQDLLRYDGGGIKAYWGVMISV